MARILILDGHSSAALAFTRSLGRAGHWVAVGANAGMFAAAKLSRYCKLEFSYPVSTDDARAFVDAILKFVNDQAVDLVVPITDWTILPLSEHLCEQRELLSVGKGCKVAMPSRASIEQVTDKYQTLQIAQSLGIRTPQTWLIKSEHDLGSVPTNQFPLVVKDRFSVRWRDGRAIFGGVSYAYSREELRHRVNERLTAAGDVLVQEFTAGTGVGFSCFAAGGEVRIPFQWKRIREVDPRGSASSCRESGALEERIRSDSGRLIQRIGFEGIAMVEYKKVEYKKVEYNKAEPRKASGEADPVLMEINGRPWGSIALPIASGVDYPRYLIEWWLNGALPPKEIPYDTGITCRRMIGDLTHLTNVRAGKPANWPFPYPTFWSSFLKIAVPWYPGMHYDDLWLSDPKPGVGGLANWFRVRSKRT